MLVSSVQQSDSVIYMYIYMYMYIYFFRFFSIVGYYKILNIPQTIFALSTVTRTNNSVLQRASFRVGVCAEQLQDDLFQPPFG